MFAAVVCWFVCLLFVWFVVRCVFDVVCVAVWLLCGWCCLFAVVWLLLFAAVRLLLFGCCCLFVCLLVV